MADIDQPQVRADDQSEPTSSNIDRLFAELNDRFISAAQWRLLEAGASPQERERALIAIAVTAFDTVASMAVRTVHADEAADQCRVAISEAAVAIVTHWRTELQGMRPDFFVDLRLALSSRVHYWGAEALGVARERKAAEEGAHLGNERTDQATKAVAAGFSRRAAWLARFEKRLRRGNAVDRKTLRRALDGLPIRETSVEAIAKVLSVDRSEIPDN
ncbi:MAG TPA: hypothetical protein VG538_11475 [Vicinamibacterales bacterium]|jgi:hypothetical protein|nr:hypothetical protein [Vicinamibacterales bacterium]